MAGITHVVFDVDGTLADSRDSALLSLQQVVRELTGTEPPLSELLFSTGIPGEKALERLGLYSPEALARWTELAGGLRHTITVFPGIFETLKTLRGEGFELGIVSSRARGEYASEITPLGLDPYFPIRILVEDTALHKPDPEPMLEYLRQTGARPNETLYVGDTSYDMDCAFGAGVDFAFAAWGAGQMLDGAPHVLQRPEDLILLIRQAD